MSIIEDTIIKSEDDLRRYLLARLPHEESCAQALASKSTGDILVIFFDWQNRLIPIQPRRVHCSKVLLANHQQHEATLSRIIKKLESGEDVNPHLSDKVIYAYSTTKPRKDLDLLLNDWGVHHFHLSMDLREDGFVKRTTPLLFGVIRPHDAYLIDIMPHGNFIAKSLCEIMVREWPDAELMYTIQGLSGTEKEFSEEELKQLRKVRCGYVMAIDGKNYFPASGLMSNGNSQRSFMMAQKLMRDIQQGAVVCFSESLKV